jgi:ATP-dependent DNA ligase
MIIPTPMPLGQQSKPFDDPDWLYEIKHDGFRALALIDRGHCWFVSRRKHKFHGFREPAAALVREVNAEVAVLDGELAQEAKEVPTRWQDFQTLMWNIERPLGLVGAHRPPSPSKERTKRPRPILCSPKVTRNAD